MNISSRILIQISVIIFFISCKKKEVSKSINTNYVRVSLQNQINTDFEFDSRATDFLMFSYKEKYPKYYNELIKRSYNIPKLDSFNIVSYSFQKGKLLYDLLQNNYFENEADKINFQYYINDTIKMIEKTFNHQVNAVSGFKDGKQVIILDTQNNNNYGDDEIVVFDEKFDFNNAEKLNDLPIRSFNYEIASYDTIVNFKRKLQILPSPNHPYSRFFINSELFKKYALLIKIKDYWKGKINIKNTDYEIAIQGENKFYNNIILFRPDSLKNKNIGKAYNRNFIYNFNDTIKISNNLYKIDSIYDDMSMLKLKKLTINTPFYSYRLGYTIKNFKLKSFDDKEHKINELLGKKYTLLDFWGTWCSPCKELTPSLVKLNKELGYKVNIIGVSFNSPLQDSKKYVSDNNNMNWQHTYSKDRVGIIRDLNIVSYPTFILLDSKRKILYRGTGKDALDYIEKFILEN
ncbi:TlpA family protein disulfide reductase [Polaribacter sp. BAL334]|uniref:TlpA family protein disulfide reductase n=1 Tax=Polaribacter sp. BAL334 TaxID=1708178 RepID=UPI0018D1FE64|nr:TlpA disulfide reductase family protein [Polaribacter sp. BAL334]MBG7610909.1 TlpA family protein disulfide reductase [Polaribacter sp. BAL334]